ncbi:MAG: hypothetical protein EPN91_12845 [Salinibacterium sp.]|nr:MAG: hypothetical protein EPN91_12845 [Salinibacterium sp.]
MAIEDHLGTVLCDWFTYVATWRPPGQSSTGVCRECIDSPFAEATDARLWPHDVMHPLLAALLQATEDVATSHAEELVVDGLCSIHIQQLQRANDQRALAALTTMLGARLDDIRDVLKECVAPRINDFLSREVEIAVHEFGAAGFSQGQFS